MARKPSRLLAILIIGIVAISGSGYYAWTLFDSKRSDAGNSIMVVKPYWLHGTWVFDDESVGLKQEPFVAGVPEMIDALVKDIPEAKNGFRLLFSANRFPGVQKTLTWTRGDSGGNHYKLDSPPMEGWICPALFRYYKKAPKQLFIKAEPIIRKEKAVI